METYNNNSFTDLFGDFICHVVVAILRVYLWLSRHILKRYLNIETWGYRKWWERHCEVMQKRLNYDAKMKKGVELGRVFI